jgi:hypothetical protein
MGDRHRVVASQPDNYYRNYTLITGSDVGGFGVQTNAICDGIHKEMAHKSALARLKR